MSDHATQPDPKEAVEAQLCAYLEGDLSPAERATIEAHLAGNPPHQELLADLAMTRQWLRALPREPAPAEVGEAFQQQVERSLLLGEAFEAKPRPGGGRLPQLALMAALILITAGLGVGLMLMLSGPDRTGGKLAVGLPTSRPMEVTADKPATMPLKAIVSAAPALATGAAPPGVISVQSPAVRPMALALGGGGGQAATAVADGPSAFDATPRSLHIRVVTADPAAVEAILARNGLTAEGIAGAAMASRQNRRGAPGTQYVADQQFAAQDTQQQGRMAQSKVQSNSGGFVNDSLLVGPMRYAARGLPAERARQLTAELTAAAGPGRVTVVGETPALAKDRAPIAAGELITVVVPQLTGPGVGQTNTVRVAADGTVALPMIDAVPAAGTDRDALAHRIADRYRQANLIANPTVTVMTTVTPASQPTAALERITVDVETAPAGKK